MRSLSAPILLVLTLALPAAALAHEPLRGQIEDVTRRIAAEPDRTALYLERAELLRLNGQPQRAEADLRKAEQLDPTGPAIPLCRAAMLRDAGRTLAARAALDALLARSPDFVPARTLSAEIHVALGHIGEAIADLDSALAHSRRKTPDLYLERARLMTLAGEPEPALASLDEGLRACPASPALEDLAVDLEVRLGRPDAALSRLERMMSRTPRKEALLARRGEILSAAGRDPEAWVAYSEALAAIESLPSYKRSAPAVASLESRIRTALRASTTEANSPKATP